MSTVTRVAVTARRWEHGWELYDGDEILTQSSTLSEAPAQVRDYLATEHGGDPADYEVTVTADLDGTEDDIAATAEQMRRLRAETTAIAERWRELASTLRHEHGLSVRDTATAMGISPGRVSQLLEGKTAHQVR